MINLAGNRLKVKIPEGVTLRDLFLVCPKKEAPPIPAELLDSK